MQGFFMAMANVVLKQKEINTLFVIFNLNLNFKISGL